MPPPDASCAQGPVEQGIGNRPDQGFSKSRRIAESDAFREAFDQGRRYPGSCMVMWVRSGPDAALRLGAVAAKRSFPRSVDRNLARRRMREAFRRNRAGLGCEADIVLVARWAILKARAGDVEAEFMKLAKRAGLVCGAERGGGKR
jgi:ribonuclease P protein component